MPYQVLVESEAVVFVDSQGGYAHQVGEGGRLIQIWDRTGYWRTGVQ